MQFFTNNLKYEFYLLVLLSFILIAINVQIDENALLYLVHILIGIISVIIVTRKDCAMMTQASGIFFLVFFSISPIYELSNEIIYWEGEVFTYKTRLIGVIMTFLFVLFFWLALSIKFSFNNGCSSLIQKLFSINTITTKEKRLFLFFSIIGFFFLLHLYSYQIQSLFVISGEFAVDLNIDTKASYLIVQFFLRPLIFNMGLVYILFSSKTMFYKIFLILLIICVCSPSGVSRFLVAALYMPLILLGLMCRLKKKIVFSHNFYAFPSLLLISLFVIFPLIEIFRNFSFEKFNNFSYFENQLGGSFDAFQMFLRALDVGSVNYGYGFLGAFLFFIPRAIWHSKPVTSGLEISQLSSLRLENVSMPIIGELYLNFWYFGIILGAPLIALLFKKIDSYYLRYKCSNFSLGHLVYLQLACLVVINFRGGLLSTLAYTISILLTWFLIVLILGTKSNLKY